MYSISLSYSSQNFEIWMDSVCPTSPLAVILCLFAWSSICLRKSGYIVFKTLKKYSLGGPLSLGKSSGKYLASRSSFWNCGHSCLTDSSS